MGVGSIFNISSCPLNTSETTSRELEIRFDSMVSDIKNYNNNRFSNLKDGLTKLFQGFKHDEVLEAMKEDPETHNFAIERMTEVCENALAGEREL
jgi:hypothetical protein